MPQLWLTYNELADELGCAPSAARETVIAGAWTRKHSSDGQTRVLLPAEVMQAYFTTKALAQAPAGRSHLGVVTRPDMVARGTIGLRQQG